MFIKDNKRINIYVRYTDPVTGEHGIDLTIPANRARFNIIEIPEPAVPADFSDKLYYRTEQDDAPYVIYTRKPQEQIDAATYAEGIAKIKAMESEELMPRTLREFLLEQPGAAQKPWFAKINKLHSDIEAIKAALPPAPPRQV